jgi:hypothetical protein
MIKDIERLKIITDYQQGISQRNICHKYSRSLQAINNICKKYTKPQKEKKKTIKEKKDIYINTIYNNIKESTKYLSTIDNNKVLIEEEENIKVLKDKIENRDIEIKKDIELNTADTVFTPDKSNNIVTSQQKHIKAIDKQISRILAQIKSSDISREKLKDLSSSLTALTKQKQEISGSNGNSNNSVLMQLFGSQANIDKLLQDIRDSKADPQGYIVNQHELINV